MPAVAPLTVTTIAGKSGVEGYKDGTGEKALFTSPLGIGLANNGDLLIADTRSDHIRQVSQAGVVTTFNIPKATDGSILRNPYSVKQKSDGTIAIYAYEFQYGSKTKVWIYKPGNQPKAITLTKNAYYAGMSPDPYNNYYWTGGLESTENGFMGFVEKVLPNGQEGVDTYYLPLDRLNPADREFPVVQKISRVTMVLNIY